MYSGAMTSLMATTSIPRSYAALNTSLPILPNPVIPIFKLMKYPPLLKFYIDTMKQLYLQIVKKSKDF